MYTCINKPKAYFMRRLLFFMLGISMLFPAAAQKKSKYTLGDLYAMEE